MDNFNKNTQLLCTFHAGRNFNQIILDIKKSYYLIDKKIFVFENEKDTNQIIFSYNVDKNYKSRLSNTISVHRKKQTNTLFSINSLNCIIREENGGELNPTHVIDWELYRNSLIITADIGYKIVKLNLIDIIRI